MKKWFMRLIAWIVVTSLLLLSGCNLYPQNVSFSEMQYSRPDADSLRNKLTAVVEVLPEAKSAKQIMDKFYDFYFEYEAFITNYYLAYIHYCLDMTDIYWEDEYNYCLEHTTWIESEYDQLLYDLADSPYLEELESEQYFGDGFFDAYQGDSMWDDVLTQMIQEEDALLSRYYALSAEPAEYTETYLEGTGRQIADIFVEMIALRQEIAEYAGYADYPSFAYDFYHTRDYTPQQAAEYTRNIQQTLVPLYREAAQLDLWSPAYEASTSAQTLTYVSGFASQIGGNIKSAYDTMMRLGLYDITQSEKKYDASFEVYLYSYRAPFVFVNSTGYATDKLTLTHEFGHFCRDYLTYGNQTSIDIAEVFSQGMEYLSLFYAADGSQMEVMRMSDCLSVFVEQSAYVSFEQNIYSLQGDDLTVENLDALYQQTMVDFGMDIWQIPSRSYVMVPHFFISPMYIISYIVSNDAALQIYQLEKAESGAGLKAYEKILPTEQMYFLAFVEENGLKSPFEPGRLEEIKVVLENALLDP